MSNRVFICHSSKDRPIAERVLLRLEAFDLPCWIAPRNIQPGVEFADGIMEGIESTSVFVIILTESSNQSHDVLREVNIAARSKKVIMTLWVDDIEPTKALDYYLSVVQWLDGRSSRFEQALSDLKKAVEAEFARHPMAEEAIAAPDAGKGKSSEQKPLQSRFKLANPKMAAIGTVGLFFGGVVGLSIWTLAKHQSTRQSAAHQKVLFSPKASVPSKLVRQSMPEQDIKESGGTTQPPDSLIAHGWNSVNETVFRIRIPSSWKKIKPTEPGKNFFEYSNPEGGSLLIATGEKWLADPRETPRSEAARFRSSPSIYQLAHSTVQLATLARSNAAMWDFELRRRKQSKLPWGPWEHRRIYYVQNSTILYVLVESRKSVWNSVAKQLTRAANSIQLADVASAANPISPTE